MLLRATVISATCWLSIAQLVLSIPLPSPIYNGGVNWMGYHDNAHEFLTGFYPVSYVQGQLTSQQIATIAYYATQQLKAMWEANHNLVASGNRPGTVSVWQAGNGDVWLASSNGRNGLEGAGHAEPNIIIASRGRVDGGRVLSYSWAARSIGFRDSCFYCRTNLVNYGARMIHPEGLIPDPPQVPQGWKLVWDAENGIFEFINKYDCDATIRITTPTIGINPPRLPRGWAMEYNEVDDQYYYYAPDNPTIPSQYHIPRRSTTPPSNQQDAANYGWDRPGSGRGGSNSIYRRFLLRLRAATVIESKRTSRPPAMACVAKSISNVTETDTGTVKFSKPVLVTGLPKVSDTKPTKQVSKPSHTPIHMTKLNISKSLSLGNVQTKTKKSMDQSMTLISSRRSASTPSV